jgi:hypothetical protein
MQYMCACRCGINVHMKGKEHGLHRGQPRPPGQQGRAVRQGLLGDHAAPRAGAALGADEACRPARLRRIRGSSWDEALEIATGPGFHRFAPRTRRSSPCSPAATRARASPAGGQPTSARPTLPPMAASARSTWPLPVSTRWAGRSGNSASPTGTARSYFMLFGVAEDHDSNPIKTGLGKLKANGAKMSPSTRSVGLLGHCRRVGRYSPRHRRAVRRCAHPRAAQGRQDRPRLSRPLHQRSPPGHPPQGR